jgi:hypothetical protein
MEDDIHVDFPSKKGRPKGSTNKKKKKAKLKSLANKVLPKKKKEADQIEGTALDTLLDDSKFLEKGYNNPENRVINENPLDSSYFYRGSKHVPIAGAPYEFTADMVMELQRCREDIVYFAENFFTVVTLNEGKKKIKLYPAQHRALKSLIDNRFTALMQSRQSGKSTLLTIFVLWMACFHDDHRAAIVANKETTAINIFKRIRMAYEQLPNYIKPGVKDYGKTGMTLGNDSSIIVSTTTATSIRGDTLNCLAGNSKVMYKHTDGILYNIAIEDLNSLYEV